MWSVLAAIPYTTFPDLPFGFRTFGLMVALGVLLGARVGSDYGERFGVNREDTYRTGTLMVLAGIIGSRLTWDLTHTEQLHKPLDWIAIWEGGIQFSGGFIAALIVGWPMFRKWSKVQRWHVLNGYVVGLTLGMAIGRIGCYAVGEHFGRQTNFFLANRYDGGEVRETTLGKLSEGGVPLQKGMVFHNTALYEFLVLMVLFAAFIAIIWRARRVGHEVTPVTLAALFMILGGTERFLLDTLRVNDERILHMTGAQWMSLVMVPYGFWLWFKVRPEVGKLVGADGRVMEVDASVLAEIEDDGDGEAEPVPDELEPPEDINGESTETEPAEIQTEAEADDADDADEAEEPEPAAAEAD
jgi:phosphatidylglycerol:prolipoprotein diacylglycerol transferase